MFTSFVLGTCICQCTYPALNHERVAHLNHVSQCLSMLNRIYILLKNSGGDRAKCCSAYCTTRSEIDTIHSSPLRGSIGIINYIDYISINKCTPSQISMIVAIYTEQLWHVVHIIRTTTRTCSQSGWSNMVGIPERYKFF